MGPDAWHELGETVRVLRIVMGDVSLKTTSPFVRSPPVGELVRFQRWHSGNRRVVSMSEVYNAFPAARTFRAISACIKRLALSRVIGQHSCDFA